MNTAPQFTIPELAQLERLECTPPQTASPLMVDALKSKLRDLLFMLPEERAYYETEIRDLCAVK